MDVKVKVFLFVFTVLVVGVFIFSTQRFTVDSSPREDGKGKSQQQQQQQQQQQLQCPEAKDECYYKFVEYRPSELESHWLQLSTKFKGYHTNEAFCLEAQKHMPWTHIWVELVAKMMENKWRSIPTNHEKYEIGTRIFSKFFHQEYCNGVASKELRETWIEPLAFTLRDPRWMCISPHNLWDYLLTREWILLDQQEKKPQNSQNFYFDLGASTFNEGGGGPSQQWFYNNYKMKNIRFDRMLLWEGIVVAPQTLFEPVPEDWIPGYQYFNILASVNATDSRNPLVIMKKVAKPSDFVTFKLDIDNGPIEMSLIEQIKENEEYSSLIDEFFFEHHVAFQPLIGAWGTTYDKNSTLSTSYELFTNFRKKGIRAHGWP